MTKVISAAFLEARSGYLLALLGGAIENDPLSKTKAVCMMLDRTVNPKSKQCASLGAEVVFLRLQCTERQNLMERIANDRGMVRRKPPCCKRINHR
jgi:hypothetical protein